MSLGEGELTRAPFFLYVCVETKERLVLTEGIKSAVSAMVGESSGPPTVQSASSQFLHSLPFPR